MKTKTTKKTTLPKKPITKRDKYMYDLGAVQQAKVFEKKLEEETEYASQSLKIDIPHDFSVTGTNGTNSKDWSKFSPRKEILNDYVDYSKPVKFIGEGEFVPDNNVLTKIIITLLVVSLLTVLYFAGVADQDALNAGFIH